MFFMVHFVSSTTVFEKYVFKEKFRCSLEKMRVLDAYINFRISIQLQADESPHNLLSLKFGLIICTPEVDFFHIKLPCCMRRVSQYCKRRNNTVFRLAVLWICWLQLKFLCELLELANCYCKNIWKLCDEASLSTPLLFSSETGLVISPGDFTFACAVSVLFRHMLSLCYTANPLYWGVYVVIIFEFFLQTRAASCR